MTDRAILQIIMENSGAQIVFMDRDLKIISANPSYIAGCGHKLEELVGKNHFELFPNAENEIIFKKVLKTGKKVAFYNKPFIFADQPWRGTTYWDWILNPVKDPKGEVRGLVLSLVDVTQKAEYERKKDDFINVASHELKTPITGIQAAAQMLHEKLEKCPFHAGCKQNIDRIVSQSNRLNDLVNDLIDVSLITNGQINYYPEVFSLRQLISETIQNYSQAKLLKASDVSVIADRQRIGQVLINFISNAIKYSAQDSPVEISLKSNKGWATVCVADHGIGMPPDKQPLVFNRFSRDLIYGHNTKPGLGLGLYICSEIIKAHKGKIWAESKPGEGSKFYFSLRA